MAIEFVDIENEDRGDTAPFSHVGIIFFAPDGSWSAMRPGTGFEASGEGAPQRLEPGLWVADMEYDAVRAIAKEMRGFTMRSNTWLKLTIDQIQAAFGLAGRPRHQAIAIVSAIAGRVFRLTQEALRGNLSEMGYRQPQDFTGLLERSASLATGIAAVNATAMSRSGSADKRVIDHFVRTFQSGIYITNRKGVADGFINLSFHFPRMSYARRVTDAEVPGSSLWQSASRKDPQSSADFLAEIRGFGRPAIYKAVCHPGEAFVPEYVQAFANSVGSSTGDTYRTRFIEEEILLLSRHYQVSVEGVVAGTDWIPSATGRLVRSLEAAAGGEEPARGSWSVGVAAENILASAMRSVKKESPGQAAEAVWIAARDRAAMMPAIAALDSVGASLVSAHCGNIVVRCPLDHELLMLVVNAAWESGLVLPLEEVEALRQIGVPIPEEPGLFGGNDVDYLLSAVVHKRQRNALWSLDGIMDHPAEERAKRFRIMTT
ncbi:hypothetical protein [Defluviimonas salinarum]|uniref:DUF3800 domain-containing protein n=1 Tax=Defluviimonas salinarum TaxID=2992147 RepID=A0ABT3J4M1_9RHOB|nr:hypothetical protein [Defluviimonas salinarum]MCW3782606.1 hypothetical protein [Defluviimonas salinarum]